MIYAITTGRPTLSGLGMLMPNIPIGGSFGGGAPAAGGTAPCKPCPTGCRTERRSETYYARKDRTSANDIAVPMVRKFIKCEDTAQSQPHLPCADEMAAIKAKYGLSGLSGCSACAGGYSGRM